MTYVKLIDSHNPDHCHISWSGFITMSSSTWIPNVGITCLDVSPARNHRHTIISSSIFLSSPSSPLQHFFCHHHHLIFSTFLSPSTFLPSWSSPSPSHLKHRSTIKTIIKTTTSTTRGENHDLWIAGHVGGVVSGDRLNLARRPPDSHVELLQQICHQVVKKFQCSPKPRGEILANLFLLAMLSGFNL